MREILRGRLWLGNAADGRNLAGILEAGIEAVVDLAAEEMTPTLPRSTVYCRFPIVDGEQGCESVLRVAIETVASFLKKGLPTLVFCRAGMSRSPAVVAAALSIVEGGTPEERLRQVVSGHAHDVSLVLWKAVREVCEEMRASRLGN